MTTKALGPFALERVFRAVDNLHGRLLRATRALDEAGVPYAVAGENVVAHRVSRVDEGAVRFPAEIDVLIRRADLPAAIDALEVDGFRHQDVDGRHLLLDGADGRVRDAVRILFAGERVRPEHTRAAPDVEESARGDEYQVLALEALVRMTLTSFRTKDRMHLYDMLDVGLIDADWKDRLPAELAARLQELIDNPDG